MYYKNDVIHRKMSIALGALAALAVVLLLSGDSNAQEVREGVVGTYTVAPGAAVVSPNPTAHTFRPNTNVGPVVVFPVPSGLPVDWNALRRARLAELADAAAGKIFFLFGSADLAEESEGGISSLADLLRRNPDIGVLLTGHTDLVGDSQYNLVLGERRATAIRDSLVGRGVEADRIRLESRGESSPVSLVPGADAANRRVEITTFDLFAAE